MSVDSLTPPPGRRRPPFRRRPRPRRFPLRRRWPPPLPALPRSLSKVEVAFGCRMDWDADASVFTTPLRVEDLDTQVRGRLLARAEWRLARLREAERVIDGATFWIQRELALVLPDAHPNIARRWRRDLADIVHDAERRLDALRKLPAAVLTHEPETDAWLRRRLNELGPGPTGAV